MNPSDSPALSVIVIIASDTTEARADTSYLAACLDALSRQVDAPPVEAIIPYYTNVDGMDEVKARFPDMRFIAVSELKSMSRAGGSREHHDELKALGLLEARGEIVGFLEDNERPGENWCARTIQAHREDYVGIGGAIENDIDRALNWAVYYCDFGRYQNPVPRGESLYASDANVSYKRSALDAIRPVWEQGFNEITVNAALMSGGGRLALDPGIIAYQHRSGLRLGPALRERYIWGRSFGSVRCKVMGKAQRIALAAISPLLPVLVTLKMTRTALRKRRNFGKFLKALPFTVVLLAGWGIGEMMGYMTGRPAGSKSAPH